MWETPAVEQLLTTLAEPGFQEEEPWRDDANVVQLDVQLTHKSRKREISDIHLSQPCNQDNSSIRNMPRVSSRVGQVQFCGSLLLYLHTHLDGGLWFRLLVSLMRLIREVQGMALVAIEGGWGGRETIVDQAIRRRGNLEASPGDSEIQK